MGAAAPEQWNKDSIKLSAQASLRQRGVFEETEKEKQDRMAVGGLRNPRFSIKKLRGHLVTGKDIAEILDIPEGTVMSRLYYARRKLQTLLADHRPN